MSPGFEDDLGPAGELEWARLKRQVELADGFWLGFIFAPSARATAVLRSRTERLLRGRTRSLSYLAPENAAALTAVLATLFTPEQTSAGVCWIEALHEDAGGGPSLPWQDAWLELVSRMNERRDAIRRSFSGGLILAASPRMKPLFREAASDLWSIRALVVDLPLGDLPAHDAHDPKPSAREAQTPAERVPVSEDLAYILTETERQLNKPHARESPQAIDVLVRRATALTAAGETGEALQEARAAMSLLRRHHGVASNQQQVAVLEALARAEEAHGDLDAAADHFGGAVDLVKSQVTRQRLLLLAEVARLSLERGDLRRASGTYNEALALSRQLRSSLGDSPTALRDLSVSLDNVGDVRRDLGDLQAAAAAFEESLSLSRQLRSSLGGSPIALRDLSVSLEKVGAVRRDLGDLQAAAAAFEESLNLSRQLRSSLGDSPTALRDLSISLEKVGDVRRDLGDLQAAASAFEESLNLRRQLRSIIGDTPDMRRLLISVLNRLGDAHHALGDAASAEVARREASALLNPTQR